MKIIKFRIKNYKSIINSGDCYLTDLVTILAGKNESGKTSILEALEDFDTDAKIRDEGKPIKDKDAIPEIIITFEVNKDTINEIFNEINIDKNISKSIQVEIKKTFPNIFTISESTKKDLGIIDTDNETKIRKAIKTSLQILQKIHEKYPKIGSDIPEIDFEDIVNLKTLVTQFQDQTNPNLGNISDEKEKERFTSHLVTILDSITELENLVNAEDKFIEEIKNYIPNFILFDSFNDIFPNKIPVAELKGNEWLKDLSFISDLDVEKLTTADKQTRSKHITDLNINVNQQYKQFWTQGDIEIKIEVDSEELMFWIYEDGQPYTPQQRSKGQQWHLAFYIKVSARAKDNVPNIILIDEPGLFLHANAQRDILNKLEDSAKDAQIVFSTHSPYLLEFEKLDRIRLIHRNKKNGTKIDNKIHALADKETLTPILTAIGLELNNGIQNIDKIKNIVVEGPSDVFYLQALSNTLQNKDLNFIYGGGAGNMPFVGTILQGWGCSVLYLYDNDQGKKDGEKNLIKNWLVNKELIESVLKEKGSIEDLFTKKDFKKHVLKNEKISYTSSNSEYLKKSKKDKVLISRLLLQKIQNNKIVLEAKTINNFKDLIKIIESKFK